MRRDDIFKFNPATSWMLGGPIIERERINILKFDHPGQPWVAVIHNADEHWIDTTWFDEDWKGATPLVAAMRAFEPASSAMKCRMWQTQRLSRLAKTRYSHQFGGGVMQEKLFVHTRDNAQALLEVMNSGGNYIHNGRTAKIVGCEVINNDETVMSDGSILGNEPGMYLIPHPETYVFTLEVD